MKAIFIIIVSILLLGGCGKKSDEVYMSDAPQVEALTDPNAYPSVVLVVLPGGSGICTGAFVSPRAVLTAAHCTQGNGKYTVVSSFGRFTTYTKENMSSGQLEDPIDLSLLIFSSDVAKRASNQVAYMGSEVHSGERVRLVGFGCNSLDTKLGSGIKRSGTNTIAWMDDYLHLRTPFTYPDKSATKKILGPKDEAGSCFGDSGGPMFRADAYENSIVGITHAGGKHSTYIESQYLNTARSDIQHFMHTVDTNYSLGIYDYCHSGDSIPGACGQHASLQFLNFLKRHVLDLITTIKKAFSILLSH